MRPWVFPILKYAQEIGWAFVSRAEVEERRGFDPDGAIMAASVLNRSRAVEASIFVERAFVKLREVLATHKELARKFAEVEERIKDHDEQIETILEAIRQLMAPPEKPRRRK